jgi:RNA polymerase sigma-70 factor (ECF subfamily)
VVLHGRERTLLDELRHRRRQSRMHEQAAVELRRDDDDATPEAIVERRLSDAVLAALQGLPRQQREAITMTRIEGLSHRHGAERVGSTEGAVKLRIHRDYARIRRSLRQLETA